MSPEAVAILASRAPDWWVELRMEQLRKIEQSKAQNDKSRRYQERDALELLVQAQYEYADTMLKVATKLQRSERWS